ncbi:MAG: ATP-binding protein [Chthoniobacterales bacterium]
MPTIRHPSATTEAKHFSIDARAMLTWGRDSIKDHTTAVLELVKNSYDAAAAVVEVTIEPSSNGVQQGLIRIADNGTGMSEEDVDTKWLRIGFSDKREHKEAGRRRKTGEKGIGRISADRLGSVLELRTQSKSDDAVGLRVDWRWFENSGRELEKVPLEDLADTRFKVPIPAKFDRRSNKYLPAPEPCWNSRKCTGTELTIRQLRQTWSRSDLDDLRRELSVLTSPIAGESDFQIRLNSSLDATQNGVITSPFYENAEIEAKFTYQNGNLVRYEFFDRNPKGKMQPAESGTIPWENFVHRPIADNGVTEDVAAPPFGPVSVHLLFYLRVEESMRGTSFSVTDLRQFLNLHAGIKVYRDNIRVMPYGDPRKPEGDWLGLGARKAADPAGPARPTWKVAPNQIIGSVFLSRDFNPGITDTSGREGLVHGDHFVALKAFIFGCLFRLENHYHRLFLHRRAEAPETPSPRETLRAFDAELRSLRHGIADVEKELPKDAGRAAERLRTQLNLTLDRVGRVKRSIEQLASQATIYRGLATLGIAVATFGHEIEASLEQLMSSAYAARGLLKRHKSAVTTALDELQKLIRAGERVQAWGAYALSRVTPEKRTQAETPVHELLEELLSELMPAMDASGIHVDADFKPVHATTYPMDVESVFINLLTNAYFFARQKARGRAIQIRLRESERDGDRGIEISVADSGPGVSPDIQDRIWEPLFSTKVDREGRAAGTGLGLSIVDAVIKDIGGSRSVARDKKLGGARFTIWLRTD